MQIYQGTKEPLFSSISLHLLLSSQELFYSPQHFQNTLAFPEIPLLLTLSIDHKQIIWANNKQQVHSQTNTSHNRSCAGTVVSTCDLHRECVDLRPEACTRAPCRRSSARAWFWQRTRVTLSMVDFHMALFASDLGVLKFWKLSTRWTDVLKTFK